jgi:alpha-tubulin suppressor-like RCC1 family protein
MDNSEPATPFNRNIYTKILDVNANPPPDYGYTRSLLLENTETGKGPSIELKNKNAVSSRIQMEDGASGKLNIGFVDASFDPKLSGGDGAELYPFQDFTQSNTMTRGVTINQAGGTMVAGGSTSNIGFNTPIVNSGLLGTAQYGYGGSYWYSGGTNFVTTEGKVYFAGQNGDGQAGDGTTDTKYEWIESTPGSSYPIVGWAQGTDFAQALDSAGQLWAAGENTFGKLGVGDTTDRETWTANTSIGITQAISCGFSHSLRLAADGTIQACGSGNANRLGVGAGDTSDYYYFKASASGAMSGQTAKSVWAETAGSFAVRSDNKLLFVGYNVEGQGGVGSATSPVTTWTLCDTTIYGSETPVQVSCCFDGTDDHFSMMITAEGNIYGTGSGQYNKTGLNNSEADVNKFTQCTGDVRNVTVTRVATTYNASICLDSTGNVWITGRSVVNGNPSGDDNAEFTKITEPAEFFSKTIVNVFGGTTDTFYAVDSEGTMWGVGQRIRGLGLSGSAGYDSKLFTKVPIYDVVPKEFKYTPTLTLENPNPDYGATVEFKNPNNRAFINLDDKTSNLRLGFVNNENNAGQFKGIGLNADGYLTPENLDGNSINFNSNIYVKGNFIHLNASKGAAYSATGGINLRAGDTPYSDSPIYNCSIFTYDHNGNHADGLSINGYDGISFCTGSNDRQQRMIVTQSGNVGIGVGNPGSRLEIAASGVSFMKFNYGGWVHNFETNSGDPNKLRLNCIGNDSRYGHFEVWTGGVGTPAVHRNFIAGTTYFAHDTSVSKPSGSFMIDHPLSELSNTHNLYHSFIEGPQADNIYRGKVQLVDGLAEINIDAVSNMTEGTFVALNRDTQCFTTNETNWDLVKGSLVGNILTIECQNTSSTATISWMVIGERQDKHMYETEWTDENGKVVPEQLKRDRP